MISGNVLQVVAAVRDEVELVEKRWREDARISDIGEVVVRRGATGETGNGSERERIGTCGAIYAKGRGKLVLRVRIEIESEREFVSIVNSVDRCGKQASGRGRNQPSIDVGLRDGVELGWIDSTVFGVAVGFGEVRIVFKKRHHSWIGNPAGRSVRKVSLQFLRSEDRSVN